MRRPPTIAESVGGITVACASCGKRLFVAAPSDWNNESRGRLDRSHSIISWSTPNNQFQNIRPKLARNGKAVTAAELARLDPLRSVKDISGSWWMEVTCARKGCGRSVRLRQDELLARIREAERLGLKRITIRPVA